MSNGSGSRVRWLIAGIFSPSPAGRAFTVSGERFSDVLAGCNVRLDVDVADHLGAGGTRTFELAFTRPRDFRVDHVVGQQPTLQALREIADALERPRDPISRSTAVDRVRGLVGEGPLSRTMQGAAQVVEAEPGAAAADPTTTRPSESGGASTSDGDRATIVDAIFAKASAPDEADQPSTTAARSGLDAFIGAMRGDKGTRRAGATKSDDAVGVIRAAIERTALDVLSHPRIAALEQAWRGLRMVVAESPGHDDLAIDGLDVTSDALPQALDERLAAQSPHLRPDAVFVTHGLDDTALLQQLALVGARHEVMIVVGVTPDTFGAVIDEQWPTALEPPPSWSALRDDASSRWLAVAANAVVVANDPTRSGTRLVTTDASFGLAALLSAAMGRSGTLADAVGRQGTISAPAAQDIDARGHGPVTLPTRWPASVPAQQAAAEVGVTLFGHDLDRLRLAAAPTVASSEPRQLPARILIGRAMRLAAHVRQGLRPDATPEEIARALDDAAASFLPRGPRGSIRMQGRIADGGKMQVDVRMNAALVGSDLVFELDDA